MGHPESFGLDMISVGNEQWESQYVDLYKRHQIFEKAIHEKYPDMRILGTADRSLIRLLLRMHGISTTASSRLIQTPVMPWMSTIM